MRRETGFNAEWLLWVHKRQRLAEELVQSEPGTLGGGINNLQEPKLANDCAVSSPKHVFPPPTREIQGKDSFWTRFRGTGALRSGLNLFRSGFPSMVVFAENGVIALLFLPGRGGERDTFRDLWRRSHEASTSSKAKSAYRDVWYSTTSYKNRRSFVVSPCRRTRKDGRVTGPVRQAASWKRWHGAAKRSDFHP